MKGRSRFVQPGELEVNKKRLRSITTRKSSITPPPMETTITPPSIQIAKDVVVEDEDEDDMVGDEADDVVVGDGTGDVVKVAKSEYWDVNVISK